MFIVSFLLYLFGFGPKPNKDMEWITEYQNPLFEEEEFHSKFENPLFTDLEAGPNEEIITRSLTYSISYNNPLFHSTSTLDKFQDDVVIEIPL